MQLCLPRVAYADVTFEELLEGPGSWRWRGDFLDDQWYFMLNMCDPNVINFVSYEDKYYQVSDRKKNSYYIGHEYVHPDCQV